MGGGFFVAVDPHWPFGRHLGIWRRSMPVGNRAVTDGVEGTASQDRHTDESMANHPHPNPPPKGEGTRNQIAA